MRESCVSHPANERMVILREWQLRFCGGNHCAAMLLGFFEYWHGIRLEMSDKAKQHNAVAHKHGEPGTQDESLYQFHTDQQIQTGLLGMYGREAIRAGRRLLVEKGAISEHKNPNPRYAFDATIHYLFHPHVCQEFLDDEQSHSRNAEIGNTVAENGNGSAETGKRSAENGGTSPKITSEITSETTAKNKNPLSIDVSPKKRVPKSMMSPVPDTITPSPSLIAWHKQKYPDIDLDDAIDACLTWHRSKGQKAANYEAAVQTWIRRGLNLKKLPRDQRPLELVL